MINTDSITHLSFDCYGTLIDWETGIANALTPLLADHGIRVERDRLLEVYAEAEASCESEQYRPYREILRQVTDKLGEQLGFQPNETDRLQLEESIKHWPPFDDTIAALKRLKPRFKLVILSNIDDDLFAGSAARLEVPFDHVMTAAQVKSYKPSLNNFEQLREMLDLDKSDWLHVAQSLYHDIAPCNALGISCVWVNRRHDRSGSGATPKAIAQPDFEVPDLTTLADRLVG